MNQRVLNTCNSNGNTFNVKFTFEDGSPLLAHKAILAQRCPYFRAVCFKINPLLLQVLINLLLKMFTGGTREKSEYEVAITDTSSSIFQMLLEYCYTDHVASMNDSAVLDLFYAADRLWYICYYCI